MQNVAMIPGKAAPPMSLAEETHMGRCNCCDCSSREAKSWRGSQEEGDRGRGLFISFFLK